MKNSKNKSVRNQRRYQNARRGTVLAAPSADRIPKKWLWHRNTLRTLRDRLLRAQENKLNDVADRIEPHSMSVADSASDEFDHELALAAVSKFQDALFEIDEALSRIDNGSYGVCEETGRPIAAARLKAIPWTRFSKEAEAQLERNQLIRKPSLGVLRSIREFSGQAVKRPPKHERSSR